MHLQEIRHPLIRVDLIFYSREAVAFIAIDFQLRDTAALLDGVGHLLRF